MGQLQVYRHPGGGRVVTWPHLADEVVTGQHRLVDPPGQRQALDQQHFGLAALLAIINQGQGAAQRIDGGSERTPAQRRPARHDQQGAGPVLVPGLKGQVRGQIAPFPRQPWVSRLQGSQSTRGEHDPSRGQQLSGHRLPGQHVPEPEYISVDHEQLRSDTLLQGAGDQVGVQPGGRRQQPPVELPAEQRGGIQHQALVITQPVEPGADSVGERPWHAGSGEGLLDEERNPVGDMLDAGDDVISSLRQARPHHGGDLVRGQPAESQLPGSAAPGQPGDQLGSGRRSFRPAGGHGEHGLGGQVVAEVLHDRERVRVGPVQVFKYQQQTSVPGEAS